MITSCMGRVRRRILFAGIGCKDSTHLFVGTVNRLWSPCAWQAVFRIRKRPRLNGKYFNRAMIASEPCFTMDFKFSEWVNFVDKLLWFLLNCKNAKFKPRKIFPLYGMLHTNISLHNVDMQWNLQTLSQAWSNATVAKYGSWATTYGASGHKWHKNGIQEGILEVHKWQ